MQRAFYPNVEFSPYHNRCILHLSSHTAACWIAFCESLLHLARNLPVCEFSKRKLLTKINTYFYFVDLLLFLSRLG